MSILRHLFPNVFHLRHIFSYKCIIIWDLNVLLDAKFKSKYEQYILNLNINIKKSTFGNKCLNCWYIFSPHQQALVDISTYVISSHPIEAVNYLEYFHSAVSLILSNYYGVKCFHTFYATYLTDSAEVFLLLNCQDGLKNRF